MPHASRGALDLMTELMAWNPAKRPTCAQALRYPFFTDGEPIPDAIDNVHARPAAQPDKPAPPKRTDTPLRALRLMCRSGGCAQAC